MMLHTANKAAGFILNNGMRLNYVLSIVALLKQTSTDLKFVEKRFALILVIVEFPAITIVLLDQGSASQL